MKNRIVFIVQQLSQPRCIKRIQHFKNAGYNCVVYGFNNGLYEDNLKAIDFEIIENWRINKNFNKIKKIGLYTNYIRNVIKKIDRSDVVYAFGFEIGLIVSLFWKYKFIYEEADVSASRIQNKYFRKILLRLDRRIIKNSTLTIFTSEGFSEYIFGSYNPFEHKTVFIHNKLHESFYSKVRPLGRKSDVSCIKFGFVGLIRYPNTILRFAKVIATNFPSHEFHFHGDAEIDVLNYFNWTVYSNIKFHGNFKNPEDLTSIYSNIDINVVCYDPTSMNVRIAEPNKLYESIYFNTPIVVSQNTFLCGRVRELEVGFCIDALSDSSIIAFVNSIDEEKLHLVKEKCSKIPERSLINNPEVDIVKISNLLEK